MWAAHKRSAWCWCTTAVSVLRMERSPAAGAAALHTSLWSCTDAAVQLGLPRAGLRTSCVVDRHMRLSAPSPQTRGHVIPALAEPDLQRLRSFLQEQQEAVAATQQQTDGGGTAQVATEATVAAHLGSRL